jgi:hypothetical protein
MCVAGDALRRGFNVGVSNGEGAMVRRVHGPNAKVRPEFYAETRVFERAAFDRESEPVDAVAAPGGQMRDVPPGFE